MAHLSNSNDTHNNYTLNLDLLDNKNEWTTVSYKKKVKRDERRKNNDNLLKDEINKYLQSLNNRSDFVYLQLNKYIILDCRCKELISAEITKYNLAIKNIKKSKTSQYFTSNKALIASYIKKMNEILNKKNIFRLIGMECITDQNNVQLKDLPEFKDEVLQYEEYLKNREKNNSVPDSAGKPISNSLREGVSYASFIQNLISKY